MINKKHLKGWKNNILKIIAVIFISIITCLSYDFYTQQESLTGHSHPVKLQNKNNIAMFNENTIADIVEKTEPSVVHITTLTEGKIKTYSPREFFFQDEFFRNFFGSEPFILEQKELPFRVSSTGSGTIISTDGYILTNFHVIKNATKIIVKTFDGNEYEASLEGFDRYSDIAVIKIKAKGLKASKLANSNKIRPGQWAIAVGSPHGLDNTATLGIISAVRRNVPQLSNISFIQTDAAINPGNSGGPLLNIKGEVVGINTAIIDSAQNIGFAVPINTAKEVLNELKTNFVTKDNH